MDREQIDKKYKWDFTQIFKSEEEFENLFKEVKEKILEFKKYENIMGSNATNFYNAIKESYEIERILDKGRRFCRWKE